MSPVDILLAILGISVLVIIHEGGHYFAARLFGMRVLRFSIGFGPKLFHYQSKTSHTVFQVCAIPFLAYVQIAGMNPHEDVDPQDPELFPNKSWLARATTIFAGPFANYLTASILVFGLALHGWPEDRPTSPMVVQQVNEGSPAAKAGIRSGDLILEANGQKVKSVDDLIRITAPRAGKPTEYRIERQGRALEPITLTPMRHDSRGVIGVSAKLERRYKPLPLGEAASAAVLFPYRITSAQLVGLADLVKRRSTEGLTGPVGMGKIVAEQAGKGPAEYIAILVLLSVALGMFNLLPFPALDGGRLTFLAYELITRRRPNERFEAVVHTVGLLFLIGVLVLVTFRDVMG